jgi:hypothetical protein
MVEVAGIEPASEGLQQIETTCLSDSFWFRKRNVRTGKGAASASPLSFGRNPRARIPTYPAV